MYLLGKLSILIFSNSDEIDASPLYADITVVEFSVFAF